MPIPPFAEQAASACPPLDQLALALAAEACGQADEQALEALDELARAAMPPAGLTPHGQAYALAEATAGLRVAPRGRGVAAFALDAVLRRGSGHPALLAVVQAEVARRAGLAFGIGGHGGRLFVVHRRSPAAPVVLDPAAQGLVAPEDLPDTLSWRCSHQVAFCVLGAAAREATRCGDLATAAHLLGLRLALPVDAPTRHALEREVRALHARCN
ncbi:MAG TPA: transglutaminase family protein [Baekduia sp.]|nr:transglutaminase family protein [Baekduia sp.]